MRAVAGVKGAQRYMAAYAITEIATYFALVALAVLIYERTRSPIAVAVVMLGGEIVPGLVAPALVARLDRRSSRLTIGAAYALQAAAYVLLASIVAAGTSGWALALYATGIMFVDGLCNLVARSMLRSGLVIGARQAGTERDINATLNLIMTFSMAGAPAVAGAVIAITSASFGLAVTAALLAFGTAVVLTGSRLPTRDDVRGEADEHADGVGFAVRVLSRRQPAVGALLLAQIAGIVFFTAATPLEVILVAERFGSNGVYGLLLGCWGVGAAITSVLHVRRPRGSLSWELLLSSAALGAGFIIMGVAGSAVVLLMGAFIAGLGNGVQWVAAISLIQEAVTTELQARIVALTESGASIAPAVGYIAGSMLAVTSASLAMVIAGCGALVCAAALFVTGRRVEHGSFAAAVPQRSAV